MFETISKFWNLKISVPIIEIREKVWLWPKIVLPVLGYGISSQLSRISQLQGPNYRGSTVLSVNRNWIKIGVHVTLCNSPLCSTQRPNQGSLRHDAWRDVENRSRSMTKRFQCANQRLLPHTSLGTPSLHRRLIKLSWDEILVPHVIVRAMQLTITHYSSDSLHSCEWHYFPNLEAEPLLFEHLSPQRGPSDQLLGGHFQKSANAKYLQICANQAWYLTPRHAAGCILHSSRCFSYHQGAARKFPR